MPSTKISTIALAIAAVVIAAGGFFYWSSSTSNDLSVTRTTGNPPPPPPPEEPAPKVAVVVKDGEHCGGNMMDAPVCAPGLHCAPQAGSHLPVGDVGGICVPDTRTQYMLGNLLLSSVSDEKLGAHLVGYNGMTLYTFSKDMKGVSNCMDACATNWPPYTVASSDVLTKLQTGISGKVKTITRSDSTMQVTYNGAPLYFYVGDKIAGESNGQGVGNTWAVVKP